MSGTREALGVIMAPPKKKSTGVWEVFPLETILWTCIGWVFQARQSAVAAIFQEADLGTQPPKLGDPAGGDSYFCLSYTNMHPQTS